MAKKKKSTLLLTPYDLGERISSVWPKISIFFFFKGIIEKICLAQYLAVQNIAAKTADG